MSNIFYFLRWCIFSSISFIICALLTVAPLNSELLWLRPHWLLLWVLFSQYQQPRWFSLGLAWFAGLVLDALLGMRLGGYGLVFTFTAYLAQLIFNHQQAPTWSNMARVFLLASFVQIVMLWFQAWSGQNPRTLLYWMPALSTAIVWPFFFALSKGLWRLCRLNNEVHTPVLH